MQNSRTPWVFRLWGDHSHEITVDSNTESQFLRQCCGLSIQPDQRDSLVDFGADADNGHRTILQKRRQERGCRYRRLCVRSQCGIQLFCYRKTLAINHLRLGWVLSVRAHRGRNSFAMVQRRKKVRLALNSVPNQSGGSMRGFILFFLASVALPILGCGGSGITTNTPTPLTVRPNSLPPWRGWNGILYNAVRHWRQGALHMVSDVWHFPFRTDTGHRHRHNCRNAHEGRGIE